LNREILRVVSLSFKIWISPFSEDLLLIMR